MLCQHLLDCQPGQPCDVELLQWKQVLQPQAQRKLQKLLLQVVALTTSLGVISGTNSNVFAIGLVFSLVVCSSSAQCPTPQIH